MPTKQELFDKKATWESADAAAKVKLDDFQTVLAKIDQERDQKRAAANEELATIMNAAAKAKAEYEACVEACMDGIIAV